MTRDERRTTLAEVRVGGCAVLMPGLRLDPRIVRRLAELGLRPGITVRVLMRTAGGGRVLGVDNLRIVVDRETLRAIPVTPVARLARIPAPSGERFPAPAPAPAPAGVTLRPQVPAPSPAPLSTHMPGKPPAVVTRLREGSRRLRLLGRPRLTVLHDDPVGDTES